MNATDKAAQLGTEHLTANRAWLSGYAAFQRGDGCPWGDQSARAGWLAARSDKEGMA